MDYIDIFEETSGVNLPENKITLLNGTELECFPKTEQPEIFVEDQLRLDTTGEYFRVGNKRPAPCEGKTKNDEENPELRFFLDHAHYFYQNADRILSDSRMFFAPVSVQQGLAYTGTSGFGGPFLGVFLEWWLYCPANITKDDEGNDALTFRFAGSPLSGSNSCSRVYPDGTVKHFSHSSFGSLWGSFMRVNQRYAEAKQCYEAYSIQKVYDLLVQEEQSEESKAATQRLIQEAKTMVEIGKWARKLKSLQKQYDDLSETHKALAKRYEELCYKVHHDELEDVRIRWKKHQEEVEAECALIDSQLKELRVQCKQRVISGIEYEQKKQSLCQKRRELMSNSFKEALINPLLEKYEELTCDMVNRYIKCKRPTW